MRHSVSLSRNDKHLMQILRNLLLRLTHLRNDFVAQNDQISARIIGRYIILAMDRYDAVSTVEVLCPIVYGGDKYRFDSPLIQVGMIAATYRFKNLNQLQQLIDGLQIPEYLVDPSVAMLGKAITFFCAWIQQHWGYLPHDHLNFWQPYLQESREAIVIKLRDFYHDRELDIDSSFLVTSFLDCVIIGTCRPGGGPMEAGPHARRFPEHIQRAFYNKWAKKHGLKKSHVVLRTAWHWISEKVFRAGKTIFICFEKAI